MISLSCPPPPPPPPPEPPERYLISALRGVRTSSRSVHRSRLTHPGVDRKLIDTGQWLHFHGDRLTHPLQYERGILGRGRLDALLSHQLQHLLRPGIPRSWPLMKST